MIIYERRSFGANLLLRFHGSAAAKAILPAAISTGILLIIKFGLELQLENNEDWRVQTHPYPFGVLIGVFTFLLTFRANFAYNRVSKELHNMLKSPTGTKSPDDQLMNMALFPLISQYWEAAGNVHQMMSKWLDVGIELGAFHMQSPQYDSIKPPSFGKHPELKQVMRERERVTKLSISQIAERLDEVEEKEEELKKAKKKFSLPTFKKKKKKAPRAPHVMTINSARSPNCKEKKIPVPRQHPNGQQNGGMSKLQSVARLDGGLEDRNPSLFLQETSHLISLLCAVAFSTLRNDNEHLESPLVEWVPGEPWPPVDPDNLSSDVKKRYGESSSFVTSFYYLLGITRTEKHRSLYNAARPFRVLGGVSDAECQMLQSARGPYGKVALCTMWLQEFISREYMAGSTGGVAPPIISRLFQYTSDGMVGYNQARKIAYIPFPFPHAQLTSWYVFVLMIILPVLNLSWCNYLSWACVLNFLTMLCFAGLHEVARELEAPFQNAPNDLPLTTFQAQFNEALVTMYAGFHPDAFWTVPGQQPKPQREKQNDALPSLSEEHSGSSDSLEIEGRALPTREGLHTNRLQFIEDENAVVPQAPGATLHTD
jgi:predicted membrane chloride channel (bestrophin family)